MPMRENGVLTTFRLEGALAVAFGIALVATLAALFIGEVLGQMPCTLCWYQRIAMFPLVPLLTISALHGDTGVRIYALPLALAGLALAVWQSGPYAGVKAVAIAPCTASGPSSTDQVQVVLRIPLSHTYPPSLLRPS
jgi:disulfide bond formation protein DsbB